MNRTIIAGLTTVVLLLAPAVTLTDEGSELKQIMQDLRDNLVDISDGLLTDNYEQIKRGAISIAQHPQIPSAQVQLVAAELGSEMATFKQFDTIVHDLSLEIHAAANIKNGAKASSHYQRLIEGCLACHDAYKTRVAAILAKATETEDSLIP